MMSNYMRNKNEYTNFRNQEKLRQQKQSVFQSMQDLWFIQQKRNHCSGLITKNAVNSRVVRLIA